MNKYTRTHYECFVLSPFQTKALVFRLTATLLHSWGEHCFHCKHFEVFQFIFTGCSTCQAKRSTSQLTPLFISTGCRACTAQEPTWNRSKKRKTTPKQADFPSTAFGKYSKSFHIQKEVQSYFFPLLPSASWEQSWCDGLAKEPQSSPGNLLLPGFTILKRRLGHCQLQARIILNTSSPALAFVRLFPISSLGQWHGKAFPQHTEEKICP